MEVYSFLIFFFLVCPFQVCCCMFLNLFIRPFSATYPVATGSAMQSKCLSPQPHFPVLPGKEHPAGYFCCNGAAAPCSLQISKHCTLSLRMRPATLWKEISCTHTFFILSVTAQTSGHRRWFYQGSLWSS